MLLRKTLVAPEPRARALAIHGFCAILSTRLLADDSDAQTDVILALRSACTLSPSLQAKTYAKLRAPLQLGAPSSPEATSMLFNMLVEPLFYFAVEANAALPGPQGGGEASATPAGTASAVAQASQAVTSVSRQFDATWAAWLLQAISSDERGGAAIVLPPLLTLLVQVASAPAPFGCSAQHGQITTALTMLRLAMRPEAIAKALPPNAQPLRPAAGAVPVPSSSSMAVGTAAPTAAAPALSAAETAKRSVGKLHVLMRVAVALTEWESDSSGTGEGAGSSSKRSNNSTSGRSGKSAVEAAVEMVRGGLLAACSATSTRRCAFPVSVACSRALGAVGSAAAAATSADAGSLQQKETVSMDGDIGGDTVLSLTDAVQTLRHLESVARASARTAASRLASSAILGCHALTNIAVSLTKHEAAVAQRALLTDLHGEVSSQTVDVPAPSSSGGAGGCSGGSSSGRSSGSSGGSSSGSSGSGSGFSCSSSNGRGDSGSTDSCLPRRHVLAVLSVLFDLLAAARAWEEASRNQPASSRKSSKRTREATFCNENEDVSYADEEQTGLDSTGTGCNDVGVSASKRGALPAGEAAEDMLHFTPLDQEECSLQIRAACLGLIRQGLALLLTTETAEGAMTSAEEAGASAEAEAAEAAHSSLLLVEDEPAGADVEAREVASPALRSNEIFARLLADFAYDVSVGIPVPLLLAYVSLLDDLASHCGGTAAEQAAQAARTVLTSYAVEHAAALKALLRLMLSHTRDVAAAAQAACDACMAAIASTRSLKRHENNPEVVDAETGGAPLIASAAGGDAANECGCEGGRGDAAGDGDAGIMSGSEAGSASTAHVFSGRPSLPPMKLSASVVTRVAAIQAAIVHWRTQLDKATSLPQLAATPASLAAIVAPMTGVLLCLFEGKAAVGGAAACKTAAEAIAQPAVTTRTLGLMNHLLAIAAKAAVAYRARANGGGDRGRRGGGELQAWLPVWQSLAPLLRGFSKWLRSHSLSWSSSCRRRVPAALYATERARLAMIGALEMAAEVDACAALLRELRNDWTADGAQHGSGAAAGAEEGSHAEEAGEEEEEVPQPRCGASRRRLRSRNPYIDSELGNGYGDDSFADLENFIVCKRGRKY